jgi:hypothetical protein
MRRALAVALVFGLLAPFSLFAEPATEETLQVVSLQVQNNLIWELRYILISNCLIYGLMLWQMFMKYLEG